MQLGMASFEKNITLGKWPWNTCVGLKQPRLTCPVNGVFAYKEWMCVWVPLGTLLSWAGGVCTLQSVPVPCQLRVSVLLGPGLCLSVCTPCTHTSDGGGWKYLWQLKCFAWELFWGFFEVRIFRLQGVNSPSKRFCFLIAANDYGTIKHSPLCSCF